MLQNCILSDHDQFFWETKMAPSKKNFNRKISRCTCSSSCNFYGALDIDHSFEIMNESNSVKNNDSSICTYSRRRINELVHRVASRVLQAQKRKRRQGCSSWRCTTVYEIRGKRLCRFEFSATVQMNYCVIKRQTAVIRYLNSED